MDDAFWNVRAREQEEESALARRAADLQAQIDLVNRAATLRHAPGFQDFLKAVQELHRVKRESLVGDKRLTDQGLRETRGFVQGIESVLAILTKTQVSDTLQGQLLELREHMQELMNRRPKSKPKEQVTS